MALPKTIARLTRETLELRSKDELINLVLALAPLIERVDALEREVAELKARLGQNSRNSSKPPSTDPPGTERPEKEPSGRRPGGQPGHPGASRALATTVDEVVELKPNRCGHCDLTLGGSDPSPDRHQVTELPPVVPHITEYRQHTLVCGKCGHQTRAALPEGVPVGQFGPRLLATSGLLTGAYHLSKRGAQEILRDLFGVDVSLGALSGCEEKVGSLLEAPVSEAHAWAQEQPSAHADETGWKEGRRRPWLWVLVTSAVTIFLLRPRKKSSARELLGQFAGVLHTDRWGSYNIYGGRRQICWAHLLRDFASMTEFRGPAAGRIGRDLLKKGRRMFRLWAKVRDGTWDRVRFHETTTRLRAEIERSLREGAECPHRKMRNVCRRILRFAGDLWTFTVEEGVEPTNNAAERAIRPAVLWRRKSFGTQSERGSRFVERMLTVRATLRQQGRNVIGYIADVCDCSLNTQPLPSLLPVK